jgi:tetratricopeptide (TPR) repeat protein
MLISYKNKPLQLEFCQKNKISPNGFVFLRNMKSFFYVSLLFLIACNSNPKEKIKTKIKAALPEEIAKLDKLAKQFPDSVGLHLRLVNALDSLGDYKPALVELENLIKKDSSNFGLWFKKAQLSEQSKDTINAIKSYSHAANIYASPDAMLSLANLYAETKKNQALELCQKVAELRMGRAYQSHCDFIAGIYFARTGNSTKAIQFFTKCIANNYTYMEAYMEIGFIYFDKKKYKEALKVFQTVITVKNNYPDGYYWLGKSYEAINDWDAAIENYDKSFSLDPKFTEADIALKRLKNERAH